MSQDLRNLHMLGMGRLVERLATMDGQLIEAGETIAALRGLLVEIARLKRHDANRLHNQRMGRTPAFYTLNVPTELLGRVDAVLGTGRC